MNNKEKGFLGEKYACQYLQQKHYTILAVNFSCRQGEIDIIAKKDNLIAFIEVKTRKNDKFGTASQAVNYLKQKKIIHTARIYISQHPASVNYRFDIIEIYYSSSDNYKLQHIKGAFEI